MIPSVWIDYLRASDEASGVVEWQPSGRHAEET